MQKLRFKYSTIVLGWYYTQKNEKLQLFSLPYFWLLKLQKKIPTCVGIDIDKEWYFSISPALFAARRTTVLAVVSVGTLNIDALVKEGAIVGFEVVDDIDALQIERQNEIGNGHRHRHNPRVANVHDGKNAHHCHHAHHY